MFLEPFYSHHSQKFRFQTFDHGATISLLNFRLVIREVSCQVFGTILVALWLEVPDRNLWPWCDYFSSKLLISDAWGNCDFWNCFSRIMVKVPSWNFGPWCDYFSSEFSISDAWDNPPSFWNCFSSTTLKSSNLEFSTIVWLLTELSIIESSYSSHMGFLKEGVVLRLDPSRRRRSF